MLRLLVAGRSNPQTGAELYMTAETVKSHVAQILRKLDVTSRTQAAIRGRELGFQAKQNPAAAGGRVRRARSLGEG